VILCKEKKIIKIERMRNSPIIFCIGPITYLQIRCHCEQWIEKQKCLQKYVMSIKFLTDSAANAKKFTEFCSMYLTSVAHYY
jgi:hypothetical protein